MQMYTYVNIYIGGGPVDARGVLERLERARLVRLQHAPLPRKVLHLFEIYLGSSAVYLSLFGLIWGLFGDFGINFRIQVAGLVRRQKVALPRKVSHLMYFNQGYLGLLNFVWGLCEIMYQGWGFRGSGFTAAFCAASWAASCFRTTCLRVEDLRVCLRVQGVMLCNFGVWGCVWLPAACAPPIARVEG